MSALVLLVGAHTVLWVEGGRGWLLDAPEWKPLDTWTSVGGRVLLEAEVQAVVTLYGRPQGGGR